MTLFIECVNTRAAATTYSALPYLSPRRKCLEVDKNGFHPLSLLFLEDGFYKFAVITVRDVGSIACFSTSVENSVVMAYEAVFKCTSLQIKLYEVDGGHYIDLFLKVFNLGRERRWEYSATTSTASTAVSQRTAKLKPFHNTCSAGDDSLF